MRVTLPLAPEEPAGEPTSVLPSADEPARFGSGSAGGFRVLVIDDEQDILEMVEQALERLDCRTTLLHGPANIEAALDKEEFDVVLSDLKMPGRNGLEVYRLVRAKSPRLAERFILMTGNLADADQHAVEFAAVPILPKPFTLARLRQAVEQLLPKRTPA